MTSPNPSSLQPLEVTQWCQCLAADIQASLQHRDTAHPVFHGSWDWHSAVHGHWALLSVARHTGDAALAAWVSARLQSPQMVQELRHLQSDPLFELPYGRAWLLRTLLEHEQLTGPSTGMLRRGGEAIAKSVYSWLSTRTLDPAAAEYDNPCWALLQFHAWSQHVADEPALIWCRRRVREAFMAPCPLRADQTTQEFFSRWSLQCLLIGAVLGRPTLADWLRGQQLSESALKPVTVGEAVHHLGMNASRSWGLHMAWQATGADRWRAAYWANIRASLALHESWRGDHHAYGHWVPQFSVYGLLLGSLHPESAT